MRRSRTTRALLGCAAAAGPVFLTAATVEGAVRPGYDPRRHPISSLALGPGGWQQVVNFGVSGALYLAGAVGLDRSPAGRTTAVLVGVVGAGMLGAGAFRTDPVSGYPPGTPPVHERYTRPGALHDGFSTPVFLGVPAAGLVQAVSALRRGDRAWAAWSAGSAVTCSGPSCWPGRGSASSRGSCAGAGCCSAPRWAPGSAT